MDDDIKWIAPTLEQLEDGKPCPFCESADTTWYEDIGRGEQLLYCCKTFWEWENRPEMFSKSD